jgi:hypothetical protein
LVAFEADLGAIFKMKDLGDLSQVLGMHITKDKTTRPISLDVSKYVKDILACHHMTDCKSSTLPMDSGFQSGLTKINSLFLTGLAKNVCPSLMGSAQYAAVWTRLNLSTTLSILGSTQTNPAEAHLLSLWNAVRYRHGTIDIRLTLGGGGARHQVLGFGDADWAYDSNTHKSRSGY